MSKGWVKLHRQLIDNPIFKNDKLFRVFMYCILKASHSEHDQLVGDVIVKVKSGQFVTGRKAISSDTGLTEQNVRTALSKLEKLNILTSKPTNKFSLISITNWNKYQQDNQQVTSSQPTSNQQVTTNKNGKNGKNGENEKKTNFSKPSLPDLIDYFEKYATEKSFFINRDEPERFYDFYESKNWMVGKTKMKDWKAAVRNWLRGNSKTTQQQSPAKAPRAFGE